MEKRLGRGLGSLLQTSVGEAPTAALELNSITPNPFQPRKSMDPAGLEELRDSIRAHGLLQPIVVRSHQGAFQLISGERRWRAARLAGLERIPALVRDDVSDNDMLELALVENIQRRDLNPLERAEAFRALMQQLQLTQEAVAAKVGLKRATVANLMRLLELPEPARAAVAKGLISMGHARALLGLADPKQIVSLLERVVRDDLSVRDVERCVRETVDTPGKRAQRDLPAPSTTRPAWVASIEARLREALATRATLQLSADGRGTLTLEFYSQHDLDRILDQIAPQLKV